MSNGVTEVFPPIVIHNDTYNCFLSVWTTIEDLTVAFVMVEDSNFV